MTSTTDIMLERYLAGDLPAAKAAEIKASLANEPALSRRLEALRESTAQFLEHQPPEIFARRLAGRIEHDTPPKRSWLAGLEAWSPALVLFCAVFGIFWSTFEIPNENDFSLEPQLDAVSRLDPVAPKLRQVTPAPRARAKLEVLSEQLERPKLDSAPVSGPEQRGKHVKATPERPAVAMKAARKSVPTQRSRRSQAAEVKSAAVQEITALRATATQKATRPSTQGLKGSAPKMAARATGKGMSRVMLAQAPQSLRITARGPSGAVRHLEGKASVASNEVIVPEPSWRGPLYWGYLIASPGNPVPLINELESRPWRVKAALKAPPGFSGESTVWLAACHVPFSTEDILFDGFSVRSKNNKCRAFSFSVLFLK